MRAGYKIPLDGWSRVTRPTSLSCVDGVHWLHMQQSNSCCSASSASPSPTSISTVHHITALTRQLGNSRMSAAQCRHTVRLSAWPLTVWAENCCIGCFCPGQRSDQFCFFSSPGRFQARSPYGTDRRRDTWTDRQYA